MSVLDRINQPNDIKYLSETQLEELPGEIRQFLIRASFQNRRASGIQSGCCGAYDGVASGVELSGG